MSGSTKFTFSSIDEDAETKVEFSADSWVDTFPHYLNMLRASGYFVSNDVKLYIPNKVVLDDYTEHVIFPEDLEEMIPAPLVGLPENSSYFFDTDRNK